MTASSRALALRSSYHVCGVDEDPKAIDAVRRLAGELSPGLALDALKTSVVQNLHCMTT